MFDMPTLLAGFPARGRWLINHLMSDLQITEPQAAGIVGNLGYESTGLTTLHEVGQPEGLGGYGWGQWTAGRRESFLAWCSANGLGWQMDQANYGYLIHELQTSMAWVMAHLKGVSNVEDAVFVFGRYYEAPGGTTDNHLPGYDGRLQYAKRALAGVLQPTPNPALSQLASITVDAFEKATRDLQVALSTLGYYHGQVDGDAGPQTRAALQAWKAHQGEAHAS